MLRDETTIIVALTFVGEGPPAMLHLNEWLSVGVEETRTCEKVGVESVHVSVEPVVILEVAVLVLGEGARHVLGNIMQVFRRIVDLQFGPWAILRVKDKVALGQFDVLVVVPDNDLLYVWVPGQVIDDEFKAVDPLPSQ